MTQRLASHRIVFQCYFETHFSTENESARNVLLVLLASLAMARGAGEVLVFSQDVLGTLSVSAGAGGTGRFPTLAAELEDQSRERRLLTIR